MTSVFVLNQQTLKAQMYSVFLLSCYSTIFFNIVLLHFNLVTLYHCKSAKVSLNAHLCRNHLVFLCISHAFG